MDGRADGRTFRRTGGRTETVTGSMLERTNSVVKSFFEAPGPGQSAAAQAQGSELQAFAAHLALISLSSSFYRAGFIHSGRWVDSRGFDKDISWEVPDENER